MKAKSTVSPRPPWSKNDIYQTWTLSTSEVSGGVPPDLSYGAVRWDDTVQMIMVDNHDKYIVNRHKGSKLKLHAGLILDRVSQKNLFRIH